MSKQLQSMIDIETVGTDANSGILSISAVIFDLDDNERNYIDEYHTTLDIKDQITKGRTFDEDTMTWWKQQDAEVYNEMFSGETLIEDALFGLNEFLCGKHEIEWHWAKGTHFDMAILKHAFKRNSNVSDSKFVEEFWKYQCSATVGRVYQRELGNDWLIKNMTDKYNKEFGASHNSLTDCKIQISILKDLFLGPK